MQKFSTIEQVKYWLLKRWPIADEARLTALKRVEAAMDCLGIDDVTAPRRHQCAKVGL